MCVSQLLSKNDLSMLALDGDTAETLDPNAILVQVLVKYINSTTNSQHNLHSEYT